MKETLMWMLMVIGMMTFAFSVVGLIECGSTPLMIIGSIISGIIFLVCWLSNDSLEDWD